MSGTLEDYLRNNVKKGILDFLVKVVEKDGNIIFNITPINQNDDVMEYLVTYNDLEVY